MKTILKNTLAVAALAVASQAYAQVTMYEHDDFKGRTFNMQRIVEDLSRYNFNDRASSIIVKSQPFEVCDDNDFGGRCMVLQPGRYASLAELGLNDRVTSVRAVTANASNASNGRRDDSRNARRDFRRQRNERVFEAQVVNVRAIVGTPEQRCWTEREEVSERRNNVGGAIAGAVLGGILGHQVGGGSGRNIATVGGAVAGAAVGNRVGRGNDSEGREVQRCENVANSAAPEYYDVTYNFRGQEHHVQMTQPPGRTVLVNRSGEPRTES